MHLICLSKATSVGSMKGNADWFVYLIRCADGSLYTGISTDVERRFKEHQGGGRKGAKYLRGRGPLKLTYQRRIGAHPAALAEERAIKRLKKREKEALIAQPSTVSALS